MGSALGHHVEGDVDELILLAADQAAAAGLHQQRADLDVVAVGGGLGVEAAAAALLARGEAWPEGQGADEALCRLLAAAGGGPLDIGALLAMACAAGHPEAGTVAAAVAALAGSGAALTAAQAVDLKVTLRRTSPPLWRTVRMPLASTLGDLHRAIRALFDWDGDPLHAFTAADVCYGDPLFGLEETASEEAVRLRDAFPASARKPVRY